MPRKKKEAPIIIDPVVAEDLPSKGNGPAPTQETQGPTQVKRHLSAEEMEQISQQADQLTNIALTAVSQLTANPLVIGLVGANIILQSFPLVMDDRSLAQAIDHLKGECLEKADAVRESFRKVVQALDTPTSSSIN